MGWISILDFEEGLYRFQMPNRVISELYYDYFVDIVERETGLSRKMTVIRKTLSDLSANNNPHTFLTLIKALIDS